MTEIEWSFGFKWLFDFVCVLIEYMNKVLLYSKYRSSYGFADAFLKEICYVLLM